MPDHPVHWVVAVLHDRGEVVRNLGHARPLVLSCQDIVGEFRFSGVYVWISHHTIEVPGEDWPVHTRVGAGLLRDALVSGSPLLVPLGAGEDCLLDISLAAKLPQRVLKTTDCLLLALMALIRHSLTWLLWFYGIVGRGIYRGNLGTVALHLIFFGLNAKRETLMSRITWFEPLRMDNLLLKRMCLVFRLAF